MLIRLNRTNSSLPLISYDIVLWHIQYVADIYCTLYFICRNQILRECLGALKIKKIPKISVYNESGLVGWVGGSVLHGPGLGPRAGPARSPWAGPGLNNILRAGPGAGLKLEGPGPGL